MFSIGFTDEPIEYPDDDPAVPAAPGRLILGASEEDFLSSLRVWRKSDYEEHWQRELRTLLEGNSKIALVVSYESPAEMEVWNVYRGGEWAHFQNQFLLPSNLPRGSTAWDMPRCIADRTVRDEAGDRISEWDVAMSEIESFVRLSGTRFL